MDDIALLPVVGTLLELAKEGEVSVFRLPRLDDIFDLSLNLKPKALK